MQMVKTITETCRPINELWIELCNFKGEKVYQHVGPIFRIHLNSFQESFACENAHYMHVVACLLTVLNQSITLLMIKPKMCCMQESFRRHDDTRVASLRVPYILEMWKCNHMFSLQSFCRQQLKLRVCVNMKTGQSVKCIWTIYTYFLKASEQVCKRV